MKHLFSLLVIFLLFSGCATTPPPVAPPHALTVRDMAEETVFIFGDTADGGNLVCSGVWVSDTQILTAGHCSAHGDNLRIALHSDEISMESLPSRPVHTITLDEDKDLALLVVDAPVPAHVHAQLALNAPLQGDAVCAMGHPKGLDWSLSCGLVSAVGKRLRLADDLLWIQTTAPISSGSSGGGLFNDRGELVGICSSEMRGSNLGLFVHTDYVRAFLDGLLK